jgi:hypothetical protein
MHRVMVVVAWWRGSVGWLARMLRRKPDGGEQVPDGSPGLTGGGDLLARWRFRCSCCDEWPCVCRPWWGEQWVEDGGLRRRCKVAFLWVRGRDTRNDGDMWAPDPRSAIPDEGGMQQ